MFSSFLLKIREKISFHSECHRYDDNQDFIQVTEIQFDKIYKLVKMNMSKNSTP